MEIDNEIVATGTILIENKLIHGINKVAHIEDIVVDKKTRGMGLGKKLISFLLNIAENKKCYKIYLMNLDNEFQYL